MNIILYCIKRFLQKDLKSKILIIHSLFYPKMVLQVIKLLSIKKNSEIVESKIVKLNLIELGHDININFLSKEKLSKRLKQIKQLYKNGTKIFYFSILRNLIPSSTDIELFYDEENKKYIVLNGNGRIYCFKQIASDIKIECQIYKKKKQF